MLLELLKYIVDEYPFEAFIRLLIFFSIAGGLYYLLHTVFKNYFSKLKIQKKDFQDKKVWHDIKWSFLNRLVLSLITVIKNYSLLYTDINNFSFTLFSINFSGWFYFFFSIILVLLIHETYFYFLHRLMHHRFVMQKVHKLHHNSTDPTSFTGYAFHPLETVIEFGFLPLIIFLLPLHINAFLIWQMVILLFTIYVHVGYEIMPKFWVNNFFTKYINTPTHHSMHHSKFNYNFGLYFNFWDRMFGTQHEKYEEVFLEIKNRQS